MFTIFVCFISVEKNKYFLFPHACIQFKVFHNKYFLFHHVRVVFYIHNCLGKQLSNCLFLVSWEKKMVHLLKLLYIIN